MKSHTRERSRRKKAGPLRRTVSAFAGFFSDKRVHQLTGFLLLVAAAYLLIAFTSFLFTWQADQDKVAGNWLDFLFDTDITVTNWLGKLGAILAHQFIHQWFGIASFLFVLVAFVLGFRVLFKVSLLPLTRMLVFSLFTLVWCSLLLGFIFRQSDLLFLGGGFGYHCNLWLANLLGSLGAGIFIAFALMVFLALSFNLSFERMAAVFNRPKKLADDFFMSEIMEDEEHTASIESEKEFSLEDTPETILELPTAEEIEAEIAAEDAEKAQTNVIDLKAEVSNAGTLSPTDEAEFSVETADSNEEMLSEEELGQALTEFGEYDPKLDLPKYQCPTIDLLTDHGAGKIKVDNDELVANKDRIVQTLGYFNISIDKIRATIGPAVTLYEIIPAPGTRISKIRNLADDIALRLAAEGIRIIAPMPGKGTIGIEVPNVKPQIVGMRSLIASEKFQNTEMDLPIALGKNISNETFIADLTKMPHLLIAGATGQGKSVGLNTVLVSLLYRKHPSQVKFVLVDPKRVELTLFNKIERHFLAKLPDSEEAIITDTRKVVHTLNSLCIEMDDRLQLLNQAKVRDIKEYNAKFIKRKLNPNKGHRFLPYIVLVVDEFADLIMMAGKEVETPITRLAQLARAIGVHLIIATQRPSTNIITGTIKANFPTRIAFRVISQIDSRTILDSGGAEQLVGRGDMLFSSGSELVRLQCAFVDTDEVEAITEFIGSQQGYTDAFHLPEYIDDNAAVGGDVGEGDRDAMFEEAARIVVQTQQGSASLLQRRLKLGYNRAGRIIDQLEAAGIIGPFEGSKARQVLISDEYTLEQFLKSSGDSNEEIKQVS